MDKYKILKNIAMIQRTTLQVLLKIGMLILWRHTDGSCINKTYRNKTHLKLLHFV